MAVENKYRITVNTKSKMFGEIPEIVANDNVIFEIEIFNGATVLTLLPEYSYKFVSKKLSGNPVIRDATLVDGLIRVVLGASEMTVPGKVEGTVQIFDASMKRISTAKFDYKVKKDPSMDGNLPNDERNLVIANESLLVDAIAKSKTASTESATALTKASTAETKATTAETTANTVKDQFNKVVAEAGSNNPEVVQARGTEVNLNVRLDKVSSSLAQKATQGLTCKELKMVANDETKGVDNFIKLVSAINDGYKILVDDNYFLETATQGSLDKSIIISGINEKATFTIKYGATLITPTINCKNILVDKVKFMTDSTTIKTLFYLIDQFYFDKISFNKCSFEGNISLMRSTTPITLNPVTTKYGIGTFSFEDNDVKNAGFSFISLGNTPCELYSIRRNTIKNFDHTFFGAGIDNAHSYNAEIYNAQKLIVIENNHVTCDDSWVTKDGGYHCFILFEGRKFVYKNNHVEGLKSDFNRPIYDFYANSGFVESSGNTWKNNICFNSAKTNNTLMKTKGSGVIAGEGGIKRFFNNNYVVEESFATRLGKDPAFLKVSLCSITEPVDRWEINNNVIDVYHLELPEASTQCKELWIENNTFKCKYITGYLINYRIELNVDYSKSMHKVINNTIDARNSLSSRFGLVKGIDQTAGVSPYGSVVVKGNTIVAFDINYLLSGIVANDLEVKDNYITILSTTSTDQGLLLGGTIKKYTSLNNIIKKPNGKFRNFNTFNADGDIIQDFIIQDKGTTDAGDSISLSRLKNTSSVYRYVYKFEILCSLGLLEFSTTFDYGYNSATDYNYITFISSTDVNATYKLSKSTDTGNGEGHGLLLKILGNSGGITLRFTNTPTGNTIYLNNVPDGYKTKKIKTYTTIL